MTEERQSVLYQNLYWRRLTQFKYDLEYYRLYLDRDVQLIKWCNLAITGIPMAATCVWMTWGDNEYVKMICPLIIVGFQIIGGLFEKLPFAKHRHDIYEMADSLTPVYQEMERTWPKIAHGEFTENEIEQLIQGFDDKRHEIYSRYFQEDSLPVLKKVKKSAKEEAELYFTGLFN